jgi:DNA-binding transcriptional LysR family regulator
MPASVVHEDLAAGRLIALLPDYHMAEMGVYVVHAHGRHPPARIRAFVEFLAERLRDSPWLR